MPKPHEDRLTNHLRRTIHAGRLESGSGCAEDHQEPERAERGDRADEDEVWLHRTATAELPSPIAVIARCPTRDAPDQDPRP